MVCKIVTITIPEDQLKDIDRRRGDVTRSTYISKRLKLLDEISKESTK